MRVTRIRAADFRNLPFADVDTDAPRVFLLGENGQGKTNLLEAAALVSAFRSFRTTEISPLIRMGCTEARLRLDVRTGTESTAVELRLAKGSRKALVDGNPVTSVAEHLGRFPTIVFCSDDLRLVRGSPSNRRRWLDAAIGGTDGAYLNAVRDYTRALEGRNALLKTDRPQEDAIRAFEKPCSRRPRSWWRPGPRSYPNWRQPSVRLAPGRASPTKAPTSPIYRTPPLTNWRTRGRGYAASTKQRAQP